MDPLDVLLLLAFYVWGFIVAWPGLFIVCIVQALVTVWFLRLWFLRTDALSVREVRRTRFIIAGALLFAVLAPSIWFALWGVADLAAANELHIILKDAGTAVLGYSLVAVVPAATIGILAGLAVRLAHPNVNSSIAHAYRTGVVVAGSLFIPSYSLVVLNGVAYALGYRLPPS